MKEHQHPSPYFSFTEHEQLHDRISHQRLMEIISQPDVDLHEVKEDSNSFGEYLFVTLSCRVDPTRKLYTFWGLGYHEYRERWMIDTWQWYESQRNRDHLPVLDAKEALQQLKERETFVRASASSVEPSSHARLYEMLADLTDEDGALTELEDLGWLLLNNTEDEDRE